MRYLIYRTPNHMAFLNVSLAIHQMKTYLQTKFPEQVLMQAKLLADMYSTYTITKDIHLQLVVIISLRISILYNKMTIRI